MKRRIIIEIDDTDYRVPSWAIAEAVGTSVFLMDNDLVHMHLEGSAGDVVQLDDDPVANFLTWDRGNGYQHIKITGLAIEEEE